MDDQVWSWFVVSLVFGLLWIVLTVGFIVRWCLTRADRRRDARVAVAAAAVAAQLTNIATVNS